MSARCQRFEDKNNKAVGDPAMKDTRDEIQKAATDLVMFYVGYPSLDEHVRMCAMMRKHIDIAKLRSENAALREDKARLDWLMSGHVISTVFKFNRAAIDAARKEEAK